MAAQPARLELFEQIESVLSSELAIIAEDEAARKAAGIGARYSDESHFDEQSEQWIARGGLANTERATYSRKVKDKATGRVRIVRVKPKPLSRFDQQRIAAGFTQKDLANVRAAIRSYAGCTLTPEATLNAILHWKALDELERAQGHRGAGSSQADRKAKAAAKMRAWREKKYAEGFCRTCGIRTRESGSDYCALCLQYGSERSKKSHQRKRRLATR